MNVTISLSKKELGHIRELIKTIDAVGYIHSGGVIETIYFKVIKEVSEGRCK